MNIMLSSMIIMLSGMILLFYVPASYIMYLSDFCRFLLCTCRWERRGERGSWVDVLLSLSRKNLPGVPSRDSNSGLPCSRPACYQLSYAAPSPPSSHSHLLFAYYILQCILHNTYIGIYMRIFYVHGWYIKVIKQEVFSQ